ncbi:MULTISPECIES: membrane integrity-associated transporter subunit PqiC [Tatumella]|uniref:Membrane integrity-associated transporter subunit PqiC n=1 Tax=Tatumella punctata TaxID=399969 RepID=A0ABW1VRS0_9GAMM|nr:MULTISPECIES: membrane integrity-associated transporter subunit PqiC [unclassified Tatumella]MBS0854753.1 membrane integrity-associated transporter subunit PqiC [Tatumella sp. JGM16]MBS0878141.1 membrane integrity-associated transporter subunit PqiC [Tatumella sp. JGM82]MBS0889885.1 membrane integrity-associated transporter subunit PqiC [Tatumella sp. JGM94]MBS0892466.1 membrane integrity-associated transporter subunit PqiC [Tatumella sp. JGM130]MBS0902854.1 membrane integrity-associated tr
MKRTFIAACVLLLSACSSEADKHYYQLPAQPVPVSAVSSPGLSSADSPKVLWVEPVSVSDFLSGTGLAYQTSDVQYVIATSNLWASPLDQQLQQTLVSNLSQLMPGWLVTGSLAGNNYDTLSVSVTGFHGRYDGKVIITGSWILQRGQQTLRRPFSLVLKQSQDGYAALVRTLAEGWQQEAVQIARQINQ